MSEDPDQQMLDAAIGAMILSFLVHSGPEVADRAARDLDAHRLCGWWDWNDDDSVRCGSCDVRVLPPPDAVAERGIHAWD